MTYAHGYKTFVSEDDVISFETSIYPDDQAQWRVNFHDILPFTVYTTKETIFFFFHDRESWWILILQTSINVAWWFSPHMSGHFAAIPVSNTSWVEKESIQHLYTRSSSHFIPTLTWVIVNLDLLLVPLSKYKIKVQQSYLQVQMRIGAEIHSAESSWREIL